MQDDDAFDVRHAPSPPYHGLMYSHLREIHDRIYFGAWRGPSPTLSDLRGVTRQLGNSLML